MLNIDGTPRKDAQATESGLFVVAVPRAPIFNDSGKFSKLRKYHFYGEVLNIDKVTQDSDGVSWGRLKLSEVALERRWVRMSHLDGLEDFTKRSKLF